MELVDIYEITYDIKSNDFSIDCLNTGIDKRELIAIKNREVWYNPGRYICTVIFPSTVGVSFSTAVTLGKQYILEYIEDKMDKAVQKYLED